MQFNIKYYAVKVGSYDVFINTNYAIIILNNAYVVLDAEGIKIENACIVEIADGKSPRKKEEQEDDGAGLLNLCYILLF